MEKARGKYRDIKFYSEKNGRIICVHTKMARDYAVWLEKQQSLDSYEVNIPFESERLAYVNPVEIRKLYFQTDWASDFLLHFRDGHKAIREMSSLDNLMKLATIEKLELSRRYWKALGIDDWRLVLPQQLGGVER